jgi:acylphosphatase
MTAPPPFQPELAATVRLSIRGRVQGVGFRDALSLQARRHGIDGWVRNRRDGSVEALIHGPHRAVEALIQWSHHGPPAAHVEAVERRPAEAGESATLQPGFRRLPTA